MIVEYIRYDLKTHAPQELIASYEKAAEYLQSSPECLGYDLSKCSDMPTSLILRIIWTSPDGHMNGFRKGPHFPPFLALVRPFIGEIAEMKHYDSTGVAWTRPLQQA